MNKTFVSIVLLSIIAISAAYYAATYKFPIDKGGKILSPTPVVSTAWKTYRDKENGFIVSYPAKYELRAPLLVKDSGTGELGSSEEEERLNADVSAGAVKLTIQVHDYTQWWDSPCSQEEDPQCLPTKADVDSDIAAIQTAEIGSMPALKYVSGTVVGTPAGKGLLALSGPSPQTSPQWGWSIDFYFYTPRKTLIGINIDTNIYGKDARNQVLKSQEYATMQEVISKFKFLEWSAGLESKVFSSVHLKTAGRWDKKLEIWDIHESGKAIHGYWISKDYWDWIAWKDTLGIWHVLVSLDGFDCAELSTLPNEYKGFFADATIDPSGREYCYSHASR